MYRNTRREIHWVKDKLRNKFIPCETKISNFFICPSSPDIFYTLDGKRFNGVYHPNGSMIGRKMLPPDPNYKKRETTRYY